MKMEFIKYQSLGNDFIILDQLKKTAFRRLSITDIQALCRRQLGVGADGILIMHRQTVTQPIQCGIFNSDGTKAQLCVNGIRCVAHYLVTAYDFPNHFSLEMGSRLITCSIQKHQSTIKIILNTGKIQLCCIKTIELIDQSSIRGDYIDFSNPHFVIHDAASKTRVLTEGASISTHPDFPNQTNVSYIYQTAPSEYAIAFYERGAGMTLSCGSGACAAIWSLFQRGKIKQMEKIKLHTQGGSLICYIDADNNIIQEAGASLVFTGHLS
jgi:diaminopimelate epimerase